VATVRIIAKCGWCEGEETFDSSEDYEASDWWSVFPPPSAAEDEEDPEQIYCSRECVVADLS
jgi:hypothetical protein